MRLIAEELVNLRAERFFTLRGHNIANYHKIWHKLPQSSSNNKMYSFHKPIKM